MTWEDVLKLNWPRRILMNGQVWTWTTSGQYMREGRYRDVSLLDAQKFAKDLHEKEFGDTALDMNRPESIVTQVDRDDLGTSFQVRDEA